MARPSASRPKVQPPNKALQRPGAPAGLNIERLEDSMSRSLTIRIAWRALAPAAEGRVR
jgi:hypothetical protein